MGMDIGRFLKDFTARRNASEPERKAGITVSLGEGEHTVAAFSRDHGRLVLDRIRTMNDDELSQLSKGPKSLVVCFSPRSIYADLGDFTNVSEEATLAHIRSTIDKTGLFNEPYFVSFRKVFDVDNVRARYSYLAVPERETGKISILNEEEVFLDAYCPIEASIAALVGTKTSGMAVAVYEDGQFVRVIGAKAGIIYHIIAVQKQNSFDLFAETLAGISEMSSMMRTTYGEPAEAVYKVGGGEISVSELIENGIEASEFRPDDKGDSCPSFPELVGNVHCRHYDFIPKTYRETRKLALFAGCSLVISLVMLFLSAVFSVIGYLSSTEATAFEAKARTAEQGYARDMASLEQEYGEVLKDMDLTRINELVSLYQDFQSEPRLSSILSTIAGSVPDDMSLKSIEVLRAGIKPGGEIPAGESENTETSQMPSTSNPSFHIKIEGTITAPYPQSKILFSAFLSGVQAHYPVKSASFRHTEQQAICLVECEAKK